MDFMERHEQAIVRGEQNRNDNYRAQLIANSNLKTAQEVSKTAQEVSKTASEISKLRDELHAQGKSGRKFSIITIIISSVAAAAAIAGVVVTLLKQV